MKTKIIYTALILSMLACKKTDEEKPEIVIDAPVTGAHFEPGDTFTLSGKITDNENLSQFKIDMHSGEGHVHKSSNGIFDFELIKDIEGTSYNLSEPIVISNDADTGLYHLIIEATDEEGNEANFIEIDLDIHNP